MTYQGEPLPDEVIIFSPLVEGTFLLLNMVEVQFAPERSREISVSAKTSLSVSHELLMVR